MVKKYLDMKHHRNQAFFQCAFILMYYSLYSNEPCKENRLNGMPKAKCWLMNLSGIKCKNKSSVDVIVNK